MDLVTPKILFAVVGPGADWEGPKYPGESGQSGACLADASRAGGPDITTASPT